MLHQIYNKMTVSSNFGTFSLLVSGYLLPFPSYGLIHLIVLNLVYDLSCLPFDNVDEDFFETSS